MLGLSLPKATGGFGVVGDYYLFGDLACFPVISQHLPKLWL